MSAPRSVTYEVSPVLTRALYAVWNSIAPDVEQYCEDYGYEMQRQERIDMEAGMPRKQKQLISADMIGSDRLPQKYERTDPWRNVPWAHYGPQPISFGEKVGYALIWLGVLAALVLPEVMK